MKLNLIFAITSDKLFGIDNRLPWISCKEDMKFFTRTTSNTFYPPYVVMGRKTFESLPNKLEDRINVVIWDMYHLIDARNYHLFWQVILGLLMDNLLHIEIFCHWILACVY